MYESARSLDFFPVRAGKPGADLSFSELKCCLYIHLMAFYIIHGKGKREEKKKKEEEKGKKRETGKKESGSYALFLSPRRERRDNKKNARRKEIRGGAKCEFNSREFSIDTRYGRG